MKRSIKPPSFPIFFFLLLHFSITSNANDTITTTQIIRDGQTLVSSSQIFELGFFSPGVSSNRYVGIWFKNIKPQTVVWVANREAPLRNNNTTTTSGGVLTVNPQGQLIIHDNNNKLVWSTNTSRDDARNPVAQLLDSGNLVIREADYYLWQSFDCPTDTMLSGMRLGVNLVTGKQAYLTSWKSDEDPASGDFTMGLDVTGYPQMVTRRGGDAVVVYRSGPWNGLHIGSLPILRPVSVFLCEEALVMNSSVVYYNRSMPLMSMFTLTPNGVGQAVSWDRGWSVLYKTPVDVCDNYGSCGPHGSCNIDSVPVCGCLQRFVPRDKESWGVSVWSDGCVRRAPLNCSTDVFFKYSGIKMPDARHTWYNESSSIGECKVLCLRNCSCTAYSNLNVSEGGSGCLLWFGDLVDIKEVAGETREIYIRMAASELGSNGRKETIFVAVLTSLAGIVLLGLSLALFIWKRKKNDQKLPTDQEGSKKSHDENLELPIYDMSTLSKATNEFSNNNKIGEGGFGHVYKGMLDDGKKIAVKRLSKTSSQGVEEFKSEINCIAKLQHRNLVKLLGCCIEGEERMLIYEYMPNKSLDFILFDKIKSKQLDWPTRFLVINGVARGLTYLHQDSRLRIIHRDLNASNILLDDDFNPKITDFGIAKIFRGNEIEANTKRVVGTHGYMSPEYAGYGLFSLKSDVYSFGVLALEIVSGQRIINYHHADNHHHLLRHAWILYNDGRSLELVDPNIVNTINVYKLERLIHVALLCVQQLPEDRPIMSSVVLMLDSEDVLPEAKQPGFFATSKEYAIWSSTEYTVTKLQGR